MAIGYLFGNNYFFHAHTHVYISYLPTNIHKCHDTNTSTLMFINVQIIIYNVIDVRNNS